MIDRAAQFSPFAALTGHGAAVSETERLTENFAEPDEYEKSIINEKLRFLAELRVENPDMTLSELAESFDPPLTKSGVNHRLARLEAIAKELSTRHTEE